MTLSLLVKRLREHKVILKVEYDKLLCTIPKQGIPDDLRDELLTNKEELKSYIAGVSRAKLGLDSIQKKPQHIDKVPLSFAQQRLWLMDQIEDSSAHTNMTFALKLNGDLNYDSVNVAFTQIIERHESIRTNFKLDESGEPYQCIRKPTGFSFEYSDLSGASLASQDAKVHELIDNLTKKQFDLSSDLLLRAQLIKLKPSEHVLHISLHHIASDGWSMAILVEEFRAIYSGCVLDKDCILNSMEIQYADYAYWQRNNLQYEVIDKQLGYWKKQLSGLPLVHGLPLDNPRPKVQTINGCRHKSIIENSVIEQLRILCAAHDATIFMGLQATFALLMSRYSSNTDIIMGALTANREQPEIVQHIGCFFNALVLRNNLSENLSFCELLKQSKSILLDAYANQQVPFEQVVEQIQPERSVSHSPLFQVLIIMQNIDSSSLDLPGLKVDALETKIDHVPYDLRLEIHENQQGISLNWDYNTDLFNSKTIEQMAFHFGTLLSSVISSPNDSVYSLKMLGDHPYDNQLHELNNTSKKYPAEDCLHHLFEKQVAQTPEATAVVFEGQEISYQDLNVKSNRLAYFLKKERKVLPDMLVGVCMERSIDLVVAILGILKSGGAYVPLDPDYPEKRLSYILDDTQMKTVLSSQKHLNKLPNDINKVVCLDNSGVKEKLHEVCGDSIKNSISHVSPSHCAYVIYTSGSTGRPKGVMVEHTAVVNRVVWMNSKYHCDPSDAILQKTPYSFDVSVWEFFWPLIAGAKLVLAKPHGHKDPEYLTSLIREREISKLHFVPSMLNQMLNFGGFKKCSSLRQVFCSGELLPHSYVNEFFSQVPEVELHNLYGPTEAAIDVSYWKCIENSRVIPIGRPISNIQLYVLDRYLNILPHGVVGELYIGGVGLARGYLNLPDVTKNSFIDNPFYEPSNSSSSRRLYKTGDLVRRHYNGELEFLGRRDNQVKVRGFRIELGEIESAITSCDKVTDAIVCARELKDGQTQVVAYIVLNSDFSKIEAEKKIRQELSQNLPDYMLPSIFMFVDDFPITENGKVDRKKLPNPEVQVSSRIRKSPKSDIEIELTKIWCDVLGVKDISIDDSFFELGGNSLTAMKVLNRVREIFKVNIPMRSVFVDPSIENISILVESLKLNDENLNKTIVTDEIEEGVF